MIQEKFFSMVEDAGYTDITLDGETSMPIRSAPFSDVLRAVLFVLGLAAIGIAAPYALVAGAGGTVVAGTCLLGGGAILASFTPTIDPVNLAYLQADLTKLGYDLEDTTQNLRNYIIGSLDDLEIDGRKALNAAVASSNPVSLSLYITAKAAEKIFYIAKWFAKNWVSIKTSSPVTEGDFTTKTELETVLLHVLQGEGLAGVNSSVTVESNRWEGFYDSNSFYNIFAYTYRGLWCYAVFKTSVAVASYVYEVTENNCRHSDAGWTPNSIGIKLYDANGDVIVPTVGTNYFIGTYRDGVYTGDKAFDVYADTSITVNGLNNGQTAYQGWEKWGPGAGWWPYGIQDDIYSNINDIVSYYNVKWLYRNGEQKDEVSATFDDRISDKVANDNAIIFSGSDTMTGIDAKEGTGDKSFTMAVAPDALSRIREKVRDAVAEGTQAASEIAEDVTDAIGTAVGTISGVLAIDGVTPISEVIEDLGDLLPDLFPDMSLPDAPLPTTGNHSLFTIYKPDDSDLNALASYLWAHIISLESLQKFFNDPVQSLISLAMYPVNPTTSGNKNITFGWQEIESGGSPISCPTITQKIQDFDMGQVYIGGKYGSFLDYAPYTKTRIYLPFIGLVELNTDDVMNKTLHLKYRIEFLTGSCLATISVIGDGTAGCVMYQYSGNCAMQIPLTAQNFSSIYSGLITTGASILGAAITGGGSAAATAGLAGAAGTVAGSKTQIQRSGSMQGNSGLLGGMKPYVIVETPISNIPNNYDKLQGYVSNTYSLIGDLQGYNELEEFDLSILHATEEERAEIEQILKTGFFT